MTVSSLLVVCSLMEQKTDWLKETSAEITRKLQERENSAKLYKRYLLAYISMCMKSWSHALLGYLVCHHLVLGCSELEKKVDILTEMTDKVTKRQQEREDTALQYKRYLHGHDSNCNITRTPYLTFILCLVQFD